MQVKDISRTRIFRFSDRSSAFLAIFTCLVFFLYALGSYQDFLIFSRILLLRICRFSSVTLISFSVFSLAQIFFYGSIKKGFFRVKLIEHIIYLVIALLMLSFSMFIISFV